MEKIKLSVRKILLVLLIIWMITVFCLSHQTGEDSSALSQALALFLAGGDTDEAEDIEPVIRKVAHMTEYAIGGMLFYGILLTYPKPTSKGKIVLSLIFIIAYAISDELHQSFINSRNGSIGDVVIDTFGGALGIGSIFIVEITIHAIDNKVRDDLKNPKIAN